MFALVSINYIFCIENINPSANGNNGSNCETICLLIIFYLFGVFLGYISDSTSKKNLKDNILSDSESNLTGLNSILEDDLLTFLYYLQSIIILLSVLIFIKFFFTKEYNLIFKKNLKLILIKFLDSIKFIFVFYSCVIFIIIKYIIFKINFKDNVFYNLCKRIL
jgi:hypothetical protein